MERRSRGKEKVSSSSNNDTCIGLVKYPESQCQYMIHRYIKDKLERYYVQNAVY